MEIHFDVEGQLCVDPVLSSLSIGVNWAHMGGIDRTVAMMAIAVDSIYGSVASMGLRLESMSVGLHNVELWAQVAPGVIQSVSVAILERISPVIQGRHADDGHRGHAAATHVTQVHIVLYGPA